MKLAKYTMVDTETS